MNIEAGKWYVPRQPENMAPRRLRPRWILNVNERGVIYGTGGHTHRECKVETFRRWAARFKAQPQ